MVTREEFLTIPKMAREISEEEDRVAVMRAKLYSPRGLDTSEKVQSSGSQSHLADIVIDMEQALAGQENDLYLRVKTLFGTMDRVIPVGFSIGSAAAFAENLALLEERALMFLRYAEDRSWRDITETIHYAAATTFRMHRSALDKIFQNDSR